MYFELGTLVFIEQLGFLSGLVWVRVVRLVPRVVLLLVLAKGHRAVLLDDRTTHALEECDHQTLTNENKATDPAYENEAFGQGAHFLILAFGQEYGVEEEGGTAAFGYGDQVDDNDEHATARSEAGAANDARIASLELTLAS